MEFCCIVNLEDLARCIKGTTKGGGMHKQTYIQLSKSSLLNVIYSNLSPSSSKTVHAILCSQPISGVEMSRSESRYNRLSKFRPKSLSPNASIIQDLFSEERHQLQLQFRSISILSSKQKSSFQYQFDNFLRICVGSH